MTKYKHIFFDLDHTLWDLDKNAEESLTEIHEKAGLYNKGIKNIDEFVLLFNSINDKLWNHFLKGRIDKETLRYLRFKKVFEEYGISDHNLNKFSSEYFFKNTPLKNNLVKDCMEVLQFLSKNYSLHILSNGLMEVQSQKIASGKISIFFKNIITSDLSGAYKPSKKIFEFALNKSNAKKEECIMIGDSYEHDIQGAMNYGIDQVLFNNDKPKTNKKCTYEISALHELKMIF